MSRSYKHTPVYKGDKDRFAKKLANRKIRRRTKRNPYDSLTGKSNHYRKYDFETIELAIYCSSRDTLNYEVFAKEFAV
jgi:hypothetical protein